MIRLKIMISTFQIVSVTSTLFSVTLPVSLNGFFNTFKFFNLNFSSIFPIGCANRLDFIEMMIITTLSPIALVIILIATMLIEYEITKFFSFQRHITMDKDKLFLVMKDKYLNYIFFVTYLVLPSVTTTIFQMFLCTNIDPNNEDHPGEISSDDSYSSSSLYLTADMSISCTSTYYFEGLSYAIVMVILYPIGIPLIYFSLLYRNQEEILSRDEFPIAVEDNRKKRTIEDSNAIELKTFKSSVVTTINNNNVEVSADMIEPTEDERNVNNNNVYENTPGNEKPSSPTITLKETTIVTSSGRTLSPSISRIAFLWLPYKPQFWYWEIVDTTRRLILTAVLSVSFPGTIKQNILALLTVELYIFIYFYYEPYCNPTSNILAEIGLLQIHFTFLGAMIFQTDSLSDSDTNLVGGALVIVNLTLVIMIIRYLRVDFVKLKEKKGQATVESISSWILTTVWPARTAINSAHAAETINVLHTDKLNKEDAPIDKVISTQIPKKEIETV